MSHYYQRSVEYELLTHLPIERLLELAIRYNLNVPSTLLPPLIYRERLIRELLFEGPIDLHELVLLEIPNLTSMPREIIYKIMESLPLSDRMRLARSQKGSPLLVIQRRVTARLGLGGLISIINYIFNNSNYPVFHQTLLELVSAAGKKLRAPERRNLHDFVIRYIGSEDIRNLYRRFIIGQFLGSYSGELKYLNFLAYLPPNERRLYMNLTKIDFLGRYFGMLEQQPEEYEELIEWLIRHNAHVGPYSLLNIRNLISVAINTKAEGILDLLNVDEVLEMLDRPMDLLSTREQIKKAIRSWSHIALSAEVRIIYQKLLDYLETTGDIY